MQTAFEDGPADFSQKSYKPIVSRVAFHRSRRHHLFTV